MNTLFHMDRAGFILQTGVFMDPGLARCAPRDDNGGVGATGVVGIRLHGITTVALTAI